LQALAVQSRSAHCVISRVQGRLLKNRYLTSAAAARTSTMTPSLGPDATGVGWVYQYVVLSAERTLAELRTVQDWYLRYQLTKAEGVAEVASVGGFVQQYQVVVDPQKLQAYGISLAQLTAAIRASNRDVGGRVVEMSETEYVVRGRGICATARTSKRSRSRCRAARRCFCAMSCVSSSAPSNAGASPR
jgi:Cu/Ag efflux pump CusA